MRRESSLGPAAFMPSLLMLVIRHVHSVMGAFGLNASLMDAANLAWKIGLCVRDKAQLTSLMPTYDRERRLHARRIIRVSGSYLRFICNSRLPLADLRLQDSDLNDPYEEPPNLDGSTAGDLKFLAAFFGRHDQFLLGVDAAYGPSVIAPRLNDAKVDGSSSNDSNASVGKRSVQVNGKGPTQRDQVGVANGGSVKFDGASSSQEQPVSVRNGVRAPNPRVCFSKGVTGYLYDKMMGASMFHVVIFASDLQGPVRQRVSRFSRQALGSGGFYDRFGGSSRFNVVLVLKCLPFEAEDLLEGKELTDLRKRVTTVVFDDRAPDEDAHYWYGVNHARGAVVIVRPDLWLGVSAFPEAVSRVEDYFDSFLIPVDIVAESHALG